MKELKVFYIDTNKIDDLGPLSSFYEAKSAVSNEEIRLEKAASNYFKEKFIKKYEINEHGKPISYKKFFNISHSKGFVVFVEDHEPIGIDVELIRGKDEKLKNYISSEEELKYIKDNKSFFEVWTAKESLVKCLGTGLKSEVNKIPALPINGLKTYQNKRFRSKSIEFDNHIITITRESKTEFSIKLIKE